jgi:hypothetical protein
MKTTAILSTAAILGLAVQSAIAQPTINPNTRPTVNPNNIQLAVTVSGKITFNGLDAKCEEVKISLTSQPAGGFPSNFKADAKMTKLSGKECAFTIVAPKEALGQKGFINVTAPIGTQFNKGNWQNPISIPQTGKVENINGTIKPIG